MSLRFLFVLGFLGCTAKDDPSYSAVDSDGDADTDTDADADADADTDGPDDTGTQPPGTQLGFVVTGQTTGLGLQLISYVPGEVATFGAGLASVAVTGESVTVQVPEPPTTDFVEFDAEAAPGLFVATYMPALFNDTDADGGYTEGESYAGIGMAYPIYASGPIPAELTARGFVEGWNVVILGTDPVGDIMAIPIASNLIHQALLSIGGTWDGEASVNDLTLAMVPKVMIESGTPVETLLYNEPLTASWSIEVTGGPGDDHYAEEESMAVEYLGTYSDEDSSGGPSSGDGKYGSACFDDQKVIANYAPPATNIGQAHANFLLGAKTGWSVLILSETENVALTETEALQLSLSEACR